MTRPGRHRIRNLLAASALACLLVAAGVVLRTTTAVSQAADVRVVAVGDLCDPDPATCKPAADLTATLNPDRLLVLGDNAYPSGTLAQYRQSYDPHWGQFLAKTLPTVGNHEAKSNDVGYCAYFGPLAHCPTEQYRTDLGRWSVIVLESNGQPTSAELQQFQQLLVAAGDDHVLVAWHEARWSSPCDGCHGNGNDQAFFNRAVDHGVDLVVAAHDHKYERFDRMGKTGPDPAGIPQLLSGLGGAHPDPGCASRIAGSAFCAGKVAAANDAAATDGVLELTLGEVSFSWQFWSANVAGVGTVIDAGTASTR